MADEGIRITDNEAAGQFEAHVDGHLVLLAYVRKPDRVIMTHTEVPAALEGRGIGGLLARAALDDARARHLSVVPSCPFVRAYIERHPEYQDLVAKRASAQ